MRVAIFLITLVLVPSAHAKEKACTCKCVVKAGTKYSTEEGSGKDREAAGEKLKRNLGENKCELTPTCTGTCNSD
jgi:hypothetical protein